MPLLTELENALGYDSTTMSPLTGLLLARFCLDKSFTRRKFKIVKREKNTPVPRPPKPVVTPAK